MAIVVLVDVIFLFDNKGTEVSAPNLIVRCRMF